MSELHHKASEAAKALEPQYSTIEATLFEAEVRRRHHDRQVRRRAGAAVAGVTAMAMAVVVAVLSQRAAPAAVGPNGVPLVAIGEDARVVMPIGALVHTRTSEPGLLWLEVERSAVHFTVAPQHGRVVRVSAGAVDVEVVGTAFTVDRGSELVGVTVTEGKVRVRAGERDTLLSAGEQGSFVLNPPPPVAAVEEEELVEDAAVDEVVEEAAPSIPSPPTKHKKTKTRRAGSWRALAEKGDFRSAWSALQREGAPEDEPGDLLKAADVARLSGHPAESLAPLRRVLAKFRGDPRASLAAFTLGRVLLDDLGNPREAAQAFLDAHALAPKSPLAPDALARAVEAQARAGDAEAAKASAQRFLRDFPQSARVDAVKRWGGLASKP